MKSKYGIQDEEIDQRDRHDKKLTSGVWYRGIKKKIAHLHRKDGLAECGAVLLQKASTLECDPAFPVDKKCERCLESDHVVVTDYTDLVLGVTTLAAPTPRAVRKMKSMGIAVPAFNGNAMVG